LSYENYSLFTMASDGIFDQPGGPRRIAYGPKRFAELVEANRLGSAQQMMQSLYQAATEWRGQEVRRDDLSAMAFIV